MNMMRFLVAGIALAATTTALADNEAAIWGVALDRVNRQLDYWFEDGDFPATVQLLRLQAEIQPQDYEVATNLGWMLENIERYDEALAVYVRFRRANPKAPDSPFPEANFYFRRRAYAKVIPLLEPSLDLRPHANSFRLLAHSYERMDLLTDSERVWKRYIGLAPDDDPAKRNLERVQAKMKERGAAPPPVGAP
jgi:tetratricopeptide (TPR) repeat protein